MLLRTSAKENARHQLLIVDLRGGEPANHSISSHHDFDLRTDSEVLGHRKRLDIYRIEDHPTVGHVCRLALKVGGHPRIPSVVALDL